MAILDELQIKATGNTTSAQRALTSLIKKYEKLTEVAKEAQGAMGGTTGGGGGGETPTKSIKKMDDAAKKATKSMGGLFASIKRIAFYRLIRSAIKAVTSGFAEGVKAAYAWAEANNDAFKQVMDRYATRTNYLKNTLGALGATVLTALLPAFISLTDILIKGINYVSEFVGAIKGALTGDYSYYKAKEVAVEFGDATNDAANAQKKLNQQLMAFDELNVITTPKSSGKNTSQNWKDAFDLAEASDWMKSNWSWIAAGGIAALIASQVVSGLTGNAAMTAVSTLGSSLTKALQVTAGITLSIIGVKMAFEGGVGMVTGGGMDAVLKAIGGAIATALGGSLITTAAGAGGLPGIVIGLEFAVLATLAGIVIGEQKENLWEKIKKEISSIFTTGKGTNYGTNNQPKFKEDMTGIKIIGNLSNLFGGNPTPTPTPTPTPSPTVTATSAAAKSALYASHKDKMKDLLYASGGFPNMGSVFVAGEVPGQSEMVGTINGRTGVASGEEITGISEAVYSTGGETAALLRQLIAVVSDGGSMRPSAAFGRFASESLRLYKGVTG